MKWVYVTRIKGWVREHNPLTESGLVPQSEKSRAKIAPMENPKKHDTRSDWPRHLREVRAKG